MDTDGLMALALEMAGFDAVPADSQIYVPGRDLRRAVAGIDIGEAELLAAHQAGFEVAIAHHPAGDRARLGIPQVLERHATFLEAHGVPPEEAREAVAELKAPWELRAHASNYDRVPSLARFLGLPFLNIHQPWDELGRLRMVEALDPLPEDARVADAVDRLGELPEIREAATDVAVRLGAPENRLGRWAVAHACGSNGGYPVARAYFAHGVDTVVYIHVLPPDLKRLREDGDLGGKNLVVTGHIASDSLGMAPYLARLREAGMEVALLGGGVEG